MSDVISDLYCFAGVAMPVAMLSLREAAARLQVGVSTVHRWATRGTRVGGRSVRLRHVRRGSRIFVPDDALAEFENDCTEAGLHEPVDSDPPKSEVQRRAELEAIEAEATAEGL